LRGGQWEVNIGEQGLQLVQQGGQTEQQAIRVFSTPSSMVVVVPMVIVSPSVVVVQQHTGQLLYHQVYLRQEIISYCTRYLSIPIPLFRSRDILIRIRILGSAHWITDLDPDPDPALFGSGFQVAKKN
jgi:hypothetical protein